MTSSKRKKDDEKKVRLIAFKFKDLNSTEKSINADIATTSFSTLIGR